jgi:hypothetical protein
LQIQAAEYTIDYIRGYGALRPSNLGGELHPRQQEHIRLLEAFIREREQTKEPRKLTEGERETAALSWGR